MKTQCLPVALLATAAALTAVACRSSSDTAAEVAGAGASATVTTPVVTEPPADTSIENLQKVSSRVWSGGQPKPQDFAAIRDLSVTTVINVDGAIPDLDNAHAAGLRYIHIPIGYDGISNESAAALRAALLSTDEPVYIHCHHGKHRGPAMAAIALMLEGEGTHADADAFMQLAGTSKGYAGLWRDVNAFNEAACSGIPVELHEVVQIEGFTARMAAMDRTWDNIRLVETNQWQPLPSHPDIAPAHEALLLLEHFVESAREVTPDDAYLTRGDRVDFDEILAEGTTAARSLHEALSAGDSEAAAAAFKALKQSCTDCHAIFRN